MSTTKHVCRSATTSRLRLGRKRSENVRVCGAPPRRRVTSSGRDHADTPACAPHSRCVTVVWAAAPRCGCQCRPREWTRRGRELAQPGACQHVKSERAPDGKSGYGSTGIVPSCVNVGAQRQPRGDTGGLVRSPLNSQAIQAKDNTGRAGDTTEECEGGNAPQTRRAPTCS